MRAGGWIRARKEARFKRIGCPGAGEHDQMGRWTLPCGHCGRSRSPQDEETYVIHFSSIIGAAPDGRFIPSAHLPAMLRMANEC